MAKKLRPTRPVPALTPEDEAFLQRITDSKAFTLVAALTMYSDRPPPAEVMQSLKESSIARTIADANAAAKAGTLRPLTPAQHDVMAQAAPLERGRIISSIEGTMHESEDSSQLSALQNAVQEGLADSEAGKYTVVNSSEALAAHLKSLRSSQEQKK